MQAPSTLPRLASHTPLISPALWRRRAGLDPVRYHPAVIDTGQPLKIASAVFLLRLPLPFALNHINTYLLEEPAGWTIIDCGIDTQEARGIWERVLGSPALGGRPVLRIVVTHHHPDHIGLAGWLAACTGAPVCMTAGELAVAGRYADPQRDVVAERLPLWHEHGLSRDLSLQLLDQMPRYAVQVHALPAQVEILDTSRPLTLGGRQWRAIIGRGHSPEHLSLLSEDGNMMIGGDQVLPKITPNIAVWPGGDQDPLRSYLGSLEDFADLGPQTLLLPSHKQPLWGIAQRVQEIRSHHEERLEAVLHACRAPITCHEMLPTLFGRALRNEEVGFGLGEAIAHLNFLASEGVLVSSVASDGRRRFTRHPDYSLD